MAIIYFPGSNKPIPVKAESAYDGSYAIAVADVHDAHERIHEGELFLTYYTNPALGSSAAANLLFRVGPIQTHVAFVMNGGGDYRVQAYEGPTYSNVGTLLLVANHNRNHRDEISQCLAYHTPTLTNSGIEFFNTIIPGGSGPQAPGSSSKRENELVLRPSTDYLFRLTNLTNSAQIASMLLEFYELNIE